MKAQFDADLPIPHFGKKTVVFIALLACTWLIAGCSSGGQVLKPPRADVGGIQVVAVFPFANDTAQDGLEEMFSSLLISGLQAVGWYELVPTEQVTKLMAEHRMSREWSMADSNWLDLARDISADLGADGFIVGRVTAYSDEVTMGSPYRVTTETTPEWRVDQTTRATITVDARLVNVHTGATVHEQRAVGVGRVDEPRLLSWSVPSEPPTSLIPSPHRRDMARAREQAVEQAFAAFAQDILPQLETVSSDATSSEPDERDGSTQSDRSDLDERHDRTGCERLEDRRDRVERVDRVQRVDHADRV